MAREVQHWLPKFMLRKYAESDGRVFKFEKLTGTVSKIPPKKAAAEVGFNEFETDGSHFSLEFRFEQSETAVAPILKKIIELQSTNFLTPVDRDQLAGFIVLQSLRTEAFHRGLSPHVPRKSFGSQLQSILESFEIIAHFVRSRPVLLMTTKFSAPFWLGDNPVTLQRTDQASEPHQLGFDVRGVDVYFPLDPKNSLYLPCPSVAAEITRGYVNAKRIHSEIRLAVAQGRRHLFDSSDFVRVTQRAMMNAKPIYDAITFGRPINAIAENVENFNFLQLRGASSFVFSNSSDFSLAKDILKKSPQYRTVQNVTMQPLF
jgi:Protein of unknown function (DUF4238)